MKKQKKYYHKDFETVFKINYLKHNKITDKRLKEWNIKQDKEYTINPALNDKLEERYGKLIDQGYHADMYVGWINNTVGYGAYAAQDIKMGEMVIEYTGIVQEDTPFDEDNLYLWDYPTIMYETKPGKKRRTKIIFCINAEKDGNMARFINHSLRKYQNVGIEIIPRKSYWHVIYIAKKDIKKGQQLLTYYGLSYWRDRKIIPAVIHPDE